MRATILGCLVLALSAGGCRKSEEPLRVLAAANLSAAFTEIGDRFEAANPGVRAEFSFASSGALRAQIEAGAPADVFASASQKDMDLLAGKGLIDPASRRDFAGNRLVLACPASDGALRSPSDLMADGIRRVAVGDPGHVPAGRFAKDALEAEGLWNSLSAKTVLCDSVQQVLLLVSCGEVDAGFVFRTDALQDRDRVRIAWEAPEAIQAKIRFPIAAIAGSRHPSAAAFLRFVCGPEGREILQARGYGIIPGRMD
jgi:molybdate transport system substrate-binding protein